MPNVMPTWMRIPAWNASLAGAISPTYIGDSTCAAPIGAPTRMLVNISSVKPSAGPRLYDSAHAPCISRQPTTDSTPSRTKLRLRPMRSMIAPTGKQPTVPPMIIELANNPCCEALQPWTCEHAFDVLSYVHTDAPVSASTSDPQPPESPLNTVQFSPSAYAHTPPAPPPASPEATQRHAYDAPSVDDAANAADAVHDRSVVKLLQSVANWLYAMYTAGKPMEYPTYIPESKFTTQTRATSRRRVTCA
mmetsp:Transcript_1978/g.2067  ORF Transcript_1978/g.2067 Transcript_1978/m.2067 type:complete len:248 (-) Transcript_1978:56-799(-)